jgi:hypothetical protein
VKTHKVEIAFQEVDSTIGCGFRQSWCKGERGRGKKRETVELTSGAGCGSPYLVFTKESGGATRSLVLDIRKLIPLLDEVLS